ncbi:recombinase family protein [Rickettsiales endosymbiont of Stachyamoeba lipophora]|uniref:recombinase family protein n=1 Tax=Rickettsiales endosymbiont of Stachyamoeba lipophora TaxID=2486578 RepID=UPI001F49F87A|nr:recombinase family protein [Rickettsiales endosymbiont of Stachyamoeba lipophora]
MPAKRNGLQKALDFLQNRDCLVAWKLGRLGRSLTHLLEIITSLQQRGIAFRSLTEQMDTATPHDELLFNFFVSLAQYERALTRERVMAGVKAAKRRGKRGGRPRAINEEKMEAVLDDLKSGISKAAINGDWWGSHLGTCLSLTIDRLLKFFQLKERYQFKGKVSMLAGRFPTL